MFSFAAVGAATASAWFAWHAVKVGQEQIEISRDAEKRQLRAYVGAEYSSFRFSCVGCNRDEAKRTYGTRIGYFVKNFGLTPAQHVAICSYAFYGADLVTKRDIGDAISRCAHMPQIFQSTMYPGEAVPYFRPVAPEPAASAQSQFEHLHIITHVQYVDVFGDSRETWVCKTYYFSGQDFFVGCLTDAMPLDK